jgi:tRNA-specific 2-thiouridylase
VPDLSGEFVSAEGKPLGQHNGTHRYTVGQRKGLGVTAPDPLYVLQIEDSSRKITLGTEQQLYRTELRARDLNWISIPELTEPIRVDAKVRHRHPESLAWVYPEADGEVRVVFDEPQRSITPGQSVVFYQGDEVTGGGWIV